MKVALGPMFYSTSDDQALKIFALVNKSNFLQTVCSYFLAIKERKQISFKKIPFITTTFLNTLVQVFTK